ncbi:MAG: LpqB family beta-propeller domain-containing protein [Anaerolineae bacterium]
MSRSVSILLCLLLIVMPAFAQDVTPASCPDTLPARLQTGSFARVTPGGGANRVRSQPTTSGEALGRIPAGGIFWVHDGPECADGYIWWYAEYRGLNGWTVEATADAYWLEPVADDDAPILNIEGLSSLVVYESRDRNGDSAILVSDLAGDVSVSLTPPAVSDYTPLVSPDFSQIVFDSYYEGLYHLTVMGFDGSFRREVGQNLTADETTWAPDSARLTFRLEGTNPNSDSHGLIGSLYMMGLNASEPTRLTPGYDDYGQAVWSPDGTHIAYSVCAEGSPSALWVMDMASGESHPVLSLEGANIGASAWSPDGTAIALRAVINGAPNTTQYFVVNADGTNLRQPTGDSQNTEEFAWSPDGTRIAFVSERTGYSEIYIVTADGGSLTQVTHDEACAINPAWTSDGQHILFVSNRDRERQNLCVGDVYMIDASGDNLLRITDNGRDNHSPQWVDIAPPLPNSSAVL